MIEKKILIILVLLFMKSTISNAQFLERLQNKIERKLERKAEEKIDKKIDQGIDEITSEKRNKKEKKRKKKNAKNSNSKLSEIYTFTHEAKVLVTSTSKEKETFKMSILSNPDKPSYVGIRVDMSEYSEEKMAGESFVIMEDGDAHVFVETQGMKIRISSSKMGKQQQNPTSQMANYDYSKIKKTGRTKTILGTTCYEYIMTDDKTKVELWSAPSIDVPNWFMQNKETLNGYIMEYTLTSKDGTVKSEIIAFNDNINQTLNSTEYRKMF